MNAEDMRAALRKRLYSATGSLGEFAVRAALPVVRSIVATELRDLADQRVWVTEHGNEVVSARDLYARADELDVGDE